MAQIDARPPTGRLALEPDGGRLWVANAAGVRGDRQTASLKVAARIEVGTLTEAGGPRRDLSLSEGRPPPVHRRRQGPGPGRDRYQRGSPSVSKWSCRRLADLGRLVAARPAAYVVAATRGRSSSSSSNSCASARP